MGVLRLAGACQGNGAPGGRHGGRTGEVCVVVPSAMGMFSGSLAWPCLNSPLPLGALSASLSLMCATGEGHSAPGLPACRGPETARLHSSLSDRVRLYLKKRKKVIFKRSAFGSFASLCIHISHSLKVNILTLCP